MRLQQAIHKEIQQARIGQTLNIMADEAHDDGTFTGRSAWDTPDVDTVVRFRVPDALKIEPGSIVAVRITASDDYDLQGVLT
jgi:ribosomal protein S12 methylthiotransferase